jgi:methylmalonyl-CoA/ethylmalonyl-CoA epimerase
MVKRGPMRIELLCPPEPIPQSKQRWTSNEDLQTTGNKHLAIAIREVDVVLHLLKAANVDIESTGHYPWGTNIFIRDPFGSLIELVEQPDLF